MTNSDVPILTLNNGVKMPQLGIGVYQAKSGEETESAVTEAINAGYRLIDTAAFYNNEESVGRALAASNVPREKLFVTTKLWNSDQGKDNVRPAFEKSLKKLGLDYVDLYLIHWPLPKKNTFIETWKVFEELYNEGKIRAIGVSNFLPEHLDELAKHSAVVPAVNQIEIHPDFSQESSRDYDKAHGIQTESWSPIGGSGGKLLNNETLQSIANAHGKSPAQVVIRWHIQHGLAVIPKSVHKERIKQNFDVFDFKLSSDEMTQIDSLEANNRQGPDPATMNVA